MSADYSTAGRKEKSGESCGLWVVYLLVCADSSLYAGVTTDIARRVRQHNGEIQGGARFTQPRRPVEVVWQQSAPNRSVAQQWEARLKRLSRAAKEALVRSGVGFADELTDGGSAMIDVFWRWADRWRDDELSEMLLELQDRHGLVVLELLFMAWLSERGIRLDARQWRVLHDAAKPWVRSVVIPLRQQRVRWRQHVEYTSLRKRLQQLELAAERALAEIYSDALAQMLDAPDLGVGAAGGEAAGLDPSDVTSAGAMAVEPNAPTAVISGAQPAVADQNTVLANVRLACSAAYPAVGSADVLSLVARLEVLQTAER